MFFITWCYNLGESQNFEVLGSTSELINLTILAKEKRKRKISPLSEFSKDKNLKGKKMYLKRILDSAQFFIA
jgi:hypothetical protein